MGAGGAAAGPPATPGRHPRISAATGTGASPPARRRPSRRPFHIFFGFSRRYDDGEDGNQLAEGPVRRSQGADLAEWAEQHPPQDPLFFARQRVNLNQDVGLPPAEPDAFQGLSFDLQGLATCLQALPLSEVLRLPPGLAGEEFNGTDGSRLEATDERKLSEDGEKEQATPAAAEAVARAPAPPAPPPAPAPPPKPAPVPPPAPAAPPPAVPAHVDEDAELEALLGLGPAAPTPTATEARQPSAKAGGGDDLEAWLDTL